MLRFRHLQILLILIPFLSCTEIQFAPAQQGNDVSDSSASESSSDADVISTGTGTGDALTDSVTALNLSSINLFETMPYALQGGYSISFDTEETITTRLFYQIHDCQQSGNISLSGSFTSASDTTADFDFYVELGDCDGLDGLFSSLATYTVIGNAVEYTVLLNGQLGGQGCLTDFNDLIITYSEDASIGASNYTYTGTIMAACDNGTVICDFGDGTSYLDVATACTTE